MLKFYIFLNLPNLLQIPLLSILYGCQACPLLARDAWNWYCSRLTQVITIVSLTYHDIMELVHRYTNQLHQIMHFFTRLFIYGILLRDVMRQRNMKENEEFE
jgi:hypothetical protein